MPDIAHHTIASFLPATYNDCLYLSEFSRATLEHYGGTLTKLSLYGCEDDAAPLAALLQRHTKLSSVELHGQGALPAFSQAIIQGYCRGLKSFI